MSSELYLTYRIENMEKVHAQLVAQLNEERARQAEEYRKLRGEIDTLKKSVSVARSSKGEAPSHEVKSTRMSGISEYDTKEVSATGYSAQPAETFAGAGDTKVRSRDAVDLSKEYSEFEKSMDPSQRKAAYISAISMQMGVYAPESEREAKDRDSFIAYLNGLISDEQLDYDTFVSLAQERRKDLEIELADDGGMDEAAYTYLALCRALGDPGVLPKKSEIGEKTELLRKRLLEKKQQDYVMENLREVFEELHMTISGDCVLEGMKGKLVSIEEMDDCSVFMSTDGQSILFDTVVETDGDRGDSADRKARVRERAKKVCAQHARVIELMRRRGIILDVGYEQKPEEDATRTVSAADAKRRRAAAAKTRAEDK